MVGFLNAELIAIRDNMTCCECGESFVGTDSQARKLKYDKRKAYCSKVCSRLVTNRKRALTRDLKFPKVLVGKCPTCEKDVYSRASIIYCNDACYQKDRSAVALAAAAARELLLVANPELRKANVIPENFNNCVECNERFSTRGKRSTQKYCSHSCYRRYKAKRFDRWNANPKELRTITSYDDFLAQDELYCIVKGCDWTGKHLSVHVVQEHGITSRDFKRLSGFNFGSGLVCKGTVDKLRARPLQGVAITREYEQEAKEAQGDLTAPRQQYSNEARESAVKGRIIALERKDAPRKNCFYCQEEYAQSTVFGRSKYCSVVCRDKQYKKQYEKEKMTSKYPLMIESFITSSGVRMIGSRGYHLEGDIEAAIKESDFKAVEITSLKRASLKPVHNKKTGVSYTVLKNGSKHSFYAMVGTDKKTVKL